ncbi:MAG: glutathione S-transferase [Gammaproteobacteria bacterium]|nr:MAG: glutathione S-transferase [Gammaproteobacteria bacterium]
MDVPVTALYAGLLGLLAILLANQVLYARLRTGRIAEWKPDTLLRVQANFVEQVPLALILLLVLEMQGVRPMLVHAFGATLVVLRLAHAWGLSRDPGATYPRLIGAQGTFLLVSVMSVAAIYSFVVDR